MKQVFVEKIKTLLREVVEGDPRIYKLRDEIVELIRKSIQEELGEKGRELVKNFPDLKNEVRMIRLHYLVYKGLDKVRNNLYRDFLEIEDSKLLLFRSIPENEEGEKAKKKIEELVGIVGNYERYHSEILRFMKEEVTMEDIKKDSKKYKKLLKRLYE